MSEWSFIDYFTGRECVAKRVKTWEWRVIYSRNDHPKAIPHSTEVLLNDWMIEWLSDWVIECIFSILMTYLFPNSSNKNKQRAWAHSHIVITSSTSLAKLLNPSSVLSSLPILTQRYSINGSWAYYTLMIIWEEFWWLWWLWWWW